MKGYASHDDGMPGYYSVVSDCVIVLPIRTESIWLDYGRVSKQSGLLQNLSAIAWEDPFLWTASDEGRSVECLEPHHGGYRLRRQIMLDDVFEQLPGREDEDEVDIESIDVAGGTLWICGSHCIVRRQSKKAKSQRIDPRLRVRKSRRLRPEVHR
jgi:hypothetical protein